MTIVLATELVAAGGGLAAAAALAVALTGGEGGAALLVEVGGERARGPTMLASRAARELEERLAKAGLRGAARGRLCWLRLDAGAGAVHELAAAIRIAAPADVVAHLPGALWRAAVDAEELGADAALVRADLPAQRALAALLAGELVAAGLRVRIAGRAPGRVAARRALAGVEPGGETGRRALRFGRAMAGGRRPALGRGGGAVAAEGGQALPLVLGAALLLVFATLALAALGGAVTGKSRAQRAADLAALSAARSMRDDFERLFVPARLPDGGPNPAHLDKPSYLERANAAAVQAARRNGVDPARLRIVFPDGDSFAPLRVRAQLAATNDLPAGTPDVAVKVEAEAAAAPPAQASTPAVPPAAAPTASGGGYSGPLAYRQGKPMRPDVAAAFDRLAAAAAADGVALIVNSGFRSDAEQAALWAQNPDPRWVAPPGTSLHRCATELDLGPPAAYPWLAANAPRFGFLERYSWEPWHFGYVDGPAPCSAAGETVAARAKAAPAAESGDALPAFVPAPYRDAIARAAGRWNVPAALLAAQLMAESNFNPFAVSPAGAQGIAQFMPATAAGYGLDDPFDADAAIDAQAHLMADLLAQFGGQVALALAAYNAGPAPVAACTCVPSITETQAYVARILGLMDGAGAIAAAPALEVRLVD
jgi:hypothetical protein